MFILKKKKVKSLYSMFKKCYYFVKLFKKFRD